MNARSYYVAIYGCEPETHSEKFQKVCLVHYLLQNRKLKELEKKNNTGFFDPVMVKKFRELYTRNQRHDQQTNCNGLSDYPEYLSGLPESDRRER